MNQKQLDGITKARLIDSIAQVQSGQSVCKDDAEYIAKVCSSAGLETLPDYAADSYAEQYAGKTIAELEIELNEAIDKAPPEQETPVPTVAGVPQRVTRRQGKTLMELTPYPNAENLWQAALTAANSIPDAPTRIVTVNYLMESLYFEYPQVLAMASQLLGMTAAQVDAMFVAADKL
jgi:hypothetical protein